MSSNKPMGTESVSYDNESGPRHGRLYFSAFTANLVYFSCGCSLSWTSPILPKLTASNSWLPITEAEGSWIGSLLMLGGSIGPFLSIPFLNRFGRKHTIQLNTLLYIIGWLVVGFATSLRGIYLGRFLQGIAVGVYFTSVPMYLGEIAEKNLRAALVTCCEVSVSCGYLVEYGVGPNVSYLTLALVSCSIPLVTLILFFWIPESPYYLLSKGKKIEALKSICWLRSNTSLSTANEELAQIQTALSEANLRESSLKELFFNRGNIRALYLASGLLFFQQFSGINVVLFYAQPIFMKTGASFSSSASALIVGIVQTTSASFTPPFVNHIGFKIPLLVSAAGMAIAQGVLGLYFYMDLKGHDMSSFGLVPVSCLVLYILVYCLGYGPVPWAVVGEFFAPNIKSLASAICTSLSFFLAFLLTKFFSNLSEMTGTYAAFWLFSVWCVVAFLFTITLVPNTKGMSLMEIQSLLQDTGSSAGISVPPPMLRRNYTQIPQG